MATYIYTGQQELSSCLTYFSVFVELTHLHQTSHYLLHSIRTPQHIQKSWKWIMHQLPQIIWLKQCYYLDITEILDWLARGIRLLFFNNNNTHPMVNIQNSFYTQTHKIQLKLKQANRKTNPKTPCHKKKNRTTCGFCTLKLFIFKLCSHGHKLSKKKRSKKEHYISLHKPCWRDEEEKKKKKKKDAKCFCWPEMAGWKKELLTINMAVSRRGIGRPEISCHSHQSSLRKHVYRKQGTVTNADKIYIVTVR